MLLFWFLSDNSEWDSESFTILFFSEASLFKITYSADCNRGLFLKDSCSVHI